MGNFQVDISPQGNERTVRFTSDDAGATLAMLGYYENMRGGNLVLDGAYDDMVPGSPLTGNLSVEHFRMKDAPAFAHMIGVLALTGIGDALRGEGLSFAELKAPFVLSGGLLEVKDVQASGPSIGFTAKGWVNLDSGHLAIDGTLVPAYVLNSILGNIPLLGTLLTGTEEGGGIFAATFAMEGNRDKIDVTVNPLTAFAPGILRNLIGLFGAKSPEPTREEEAEILPNTEQVPEPQITPQVVPSN